MSGMALRLLLLCAAALAGALPACAAAPEPLAISYAKQGLENDGAAVEIAGGDNIIALMVANRALPPGTKISPDRYMLPKELGGLYH